MQMTLTPQQIATQVQQELDVLVPRIAVAEGLVPKLQICAETLHKRYTNAETPDESYIAKSLMVLVECQLTEQTLRLAEMLSRKTQLDGFIKEHSRAVILPGLAGVSRS